jgi:hypothetical protein
MTSYSILKLSRQRELSAGVRKTGFSGEITASSGTAEKSSRL